MQVKIIIGPTASGKSALAVARGKTDNAVIINADAMQCYDALPILTAQPSAADRNGLPHRLYGVLPSTESLTAATWVDRAVDEIRAAFAAGRTPYVVGGTGMYIKALMAGLAPMPDIPANIRANVRAREKTEGLAAVYADLQARDPATAARLKPGDTQRILRAMEVLETTGEGITAWQSHTPAKPGDGWSYHVTALNPDKETLERNIRTRLHGMMQMGVMDEVRALSDKIDEGHVPADALVVVAHGFRSLRAVLKGEKSLEDALEDTVIETRQYTKRQRTWLRHQISADETL